MKIIISIITTIVILNVSHLTLDYEKLSYSPYVIRLSSIELKDLMRGDTISFIYNKDKFLIYRRSDSIFDLTRYQVYTNLYYKAFEGIFVLKNDSFLLAHGPYSKHRYNNTLFEKGTYHLGYLDGNMVQFHENGAIRIQFPYRHGKKHGVAIEYYNNGTVSSIMNYENNRRSGVLYSFNPNGYLEYSQSYFYSPNMSDYKDTTYLRDTLYFKTNDVPHGAWIYYDSIGLPIKIEHYYYGHKQ